MDRWTWIMMFRWIFLKWDHYSCLMSSFPSYGINVSLWERTVRSEETWIGKKDSKNRKIWRSFVTYRSWTWIYIYKYISLNFYLFFFRNFFSTVEACAIFINSLHVKPSLRRLWAFVYRRVNSIDEHLKTWNVDQRLSSYYLCNYNGVPKCRLKNSLRVYYKI